MQELLHIVRKRVKKALDKDRWEHTKGVAYTACCLAMAHGADMEQAMLAGFLHDCAKCIPNEEKLALCKKYKVDLTDVEKRNPYLIHAKLGAYLAKKDYGVDDPEILHAIRVHTTGAPEMSLLDKILFVADYIEPDRDKARRLGELREKAFRDLDETLLCILSDTVLYLSKGTREIDPMTEETYHYYQKRMNHHGT